MSTGRALSTQRGEREGVRGASQSSDPLTAQWKACCGVTFHPAKPPSPNHLPPLGGEGFPAFLYATRCSRRPAGVSLAPAAWV
jgi:hypothetical protein